MALSTIGAKLKDARRFLMKCQNETVTVELKNGMHTLNILSFYHQTAGRKNRRSPRL